MEIELKEIAVNNILLTTKFQLHSEAESELDALAESICCYGMHFPLLVRQNTQGYILIDGHKRFYVWNRFDLGACIPCIILPQKNELILRSVHPMTDSEKTLDIQNLYISLAVNMVRTKVDKNILREIVRYLHNEVHLGYKTIAHRIGYSKSGVQRMLNRMEDEKTCSYATNFPPQHSLKRLRTELKKLETTIPSELDKAEDVIEAIKCVHEYIESLLKG